VLVFVTFKWTSGYPLICFNQLITHGRSQDLGFRTSIFGYQDLGFRTSTRGFRTWLSGPGFQALNARFQDLDLKTWVSGPRYLALRTRVLGPRKLSILRSSFLFPVTFLCVQWTQTDARTDYVNLYIRCNVTNTPNPLEGIFLNVQIGFLNTNLTQLPYYN